MHAHHPLRHRLFLILELQSHKDKKVAQLFSWVLTLVVLPVLYVAWFSKDTLKDQSA